MEISDIGLRLIEQHEGFSGRPSRSLSGAWAIGFGHTYGVSEDTPAITEAEAAELLAKDIEASYGPAISALGLPLSQNQFDATCSFVYQLGVGVIGPSSPFGSHLRARDWLAAGNSMLLYDRLDQIVVPDLQRRRAVERALFLAPPIPAPDPLDVLNRAERDPADAYNHELQRAGPDGAHLPSLRASLAVLRQQVWVAAIKGLEPDGSPTEKGWNVDLRARRYEVLAELSGWNPDVG